MKLKHSKEWYERHIAEEGDAEVGAGISPWPQPHAGEERKALAMHCIVGTRSPRSVKPARRRKDGVAKRVLSPA